MKKKNGDITETFPEIGGFLKKEPLGLTEMDKYVLPGSKSAPGRQFFDEGLKRSRPNESLAKSAFDAWRDFDAIP